MSKTIFSLANQKLVYLKNGHFYKGTVCRIVEKHRMENKLQIELDVISRIILLANSSFDVVKFLEADNGKESPAIRWEKNFSYFFPFVSVNFYRITIIELSKLYNHSERYSLNKLLQKFNSTQEFDGLIGKENLRMYHKQLKSNSNLIKDLLDLRNKHYAHQDEDYKNYINLEISKIEALLSLSINLFNKIYEDVFAKSFFFDFPLGKPLDGLDQLMLKVQFYDDYYKDLEDTF